MSRKTIIGGLVILLLIDIGLAYQSYQRNKTPSYDLIEVRKGEIVEKISVTGTVQPASKIDLQFTGSGKITNIAVKVGDQVSAGQILISQDSSDLVFQAQGAQAAFEISQAKLNQLLAGSTQEDIALSQTAVSNAQKSLDDAKKSLSDMQASADNTLKDYYEDEQRTLDASLLTAQNSIISNDDTLAASDLQATLSVLDSQALVEAKSLIAKAKQDYDIARSAVEKSKAGNNQTDIDDAAEKIKTALRSVYETLDRTYDALVATVITPSLTETELNAYKSTISTASTYTNTALTSVITSQQNIAAQKITNQTNINTYQAKVTAAQGALQTAQDQLAQKLAKPRQIDIDLYRAQVRQAQANLNQIQNQIAQKTLIAPIDGMITDIPVEKGEIPTISQAVISMNSLSNFEIKADIPESDIAKINSGNPVEITFDAFGSSQIWQGKVTRIDPAQTVSQGVVYYKTTVGLIGDDSKIKAGMTANLDIETARHADVLIIPTRVFKESNGKKTVKILSSGQIKEAVIQTGLKNIQGEIEVVAGLKEGDKVVIEKK